jgi:UDPglucose 6-dehydrogenase
VKAGIIGLGVVGRAQTRLFAGANLVCYDPAYVEKYPHDDLESCDFAVICVDTPTDLAGRQNVHKVVTAYQQLPPKLPTIIRSTIVPGMTGWLLTHFDRGALTVHVPEFLHERAAGEYRESGDVPWMLLGGTPEAREFFRPHLAAVHTGHVHECASLEAELAKYVSNLYWATRVTFVNEMARVSESFGAGWEQVRAAWTQDPRVNPAYTSMAGFPPGFAGACWPKDLSALIAASSGRGYEPDFLRCLRAANERFRSE